MSSKSNKETSKKTNTILVYGAGSWGSALALVLAKTNRSVLIYAKDQKIASDINLNRKNKKYLKDITFPQNIKCITSLEKTPLIDLLLIAVPSHAFQESITHIKETILTQNLDFLIATKGLVEDPVELLSSRFKKHCANDFAFIAGPNLSYEIANNLPCSATIGSENLDFAKMLKAKFAFQNFKLEFSKDIITLQVASIIKNIISIKSGILSAQGLGENAKAYLITDGLNEIKKVSALLAGDPKTLLSYGVIGDLIATCNSINSRNTKFGYELSKNNFDKSFIKNYPYLVEGINSARLLKKILPKNISLPHTEDITNLLTLNTE